MFTKLKNASLCKVSFFQALGVVAYCFLVGLIFWKGNTWFGQTDRYLGPVLVLTLLSLSVLVCGLLVFAYPVFLFWEEKKTKDAIGVVAYTAGWLAGFVLLTLLFLILR